ncbi:MAG TPA: PHP domain-containing protein [Treponemataceae bacterium]|nr:PHP domain-containing protein [Treponemataceae bacterium]
MLTNFHTHTWMCRHATGRPIDYVKAAIAAGKKNPAHAYSVLGISDHCPFPGDTEKNWIHVKMSCNQLPEYCSDVKEAAEYAPFPVYMGFECEWDPLFISWYIDELKAKWGAQYLILGAHWYVDTHGEHVYIPNCQNRKDLYRYFDETIEAIGSGIFEILAHPDLPMAGIDVWDDDIRACFSALIDAAMDANVLLEVNGEGINRGKRNTSHGARYRYPFYEFWELVQTKGARVTANADAHTPEQLLSNTVQALEFARTFDFTIENPF